MKVGIYCITASCLVLEILCCDYDTTFFARSGIARTSADSFPFGHYPLPELCIIQHDGLSLYSTLLGEQSMGKGNVQCRNADCE